jgi:hypothetical protein
MRKDQGHWDQHPITEEFNIELKRSSNSTKIGEMNIPKLKMEKKSLWTPDIVV